MICFGSCTLLMAATKNFGGVFALRFLLGISESAFFPLVIYYQTTFYRRGELARRLAIFYAASNIASAFSGLLSYGVFQIQSHLIDFEWRWLFIIEGTLTVTFAVFAYWYLPKSAAEAGFLDENEKALAFHRIQVDSSSIVNEEFSLRDSLKIFRRPTTYGFLLIEICLGVPLQGVQLFLPQIVQRLGYDSVKTNLYTVAPNVTVSRAPMTRLGVRRSMMLTLHRPGRCNAPDPRLFFRLPPHPLSVDLSGFRIHLYRLHRLPVNHRCPYADTGRLLRHLHDVLGNSGPIGTVEYLVQQ